MPTDGIWRAVALIGIIVALGGPRTRSYFASLGLQLMRHGRG